MRIGFQKPLWALTALLFLCLLLSGIALAEAPVPTFEVGAGQGRQGDTGIEIPVYARNNPGVSSVKLSVSFDADRLTLTGARINSGWAGSVSQSPSLETPYILNWVGGTAEYTVSDSTFAVLTFSIRDDAPAGKADVSISYDPDDVYDIGFDNVNFSILNGGITVLRSPISSVSAEVAAPSQGVALASSVVCPAEAYSGQVVWYEGGTDMGSTASGNAKPNQVYTAKITLMAAEGESFAESTSVTLNGGAVVRNVVPVDGKLVITYTFEKTEKAGPPAAPVLSLKSKTEGSITVTANQAWEYTKDNGITIQASNTFSGLQPNTEYSIKARVRETDTVLPSPWSAEVTVRTDKLTQTISGPETVSVIFGKTLDLNTIFQSNASGSTLVFTADGAPPVGTTFDAFAGTVTAGTVDGSFSVKVNADAVGSYGPAAEKRITITVKDIDIVWPSVTLKGSPVYGDTWNSIVTLQGGKASVNGIDIPGIFTVKNGTEFVSAGQHSYALNFKSADGQYNIDKTGAEQIAVAKKPVTVTAENKTKVYGQANPALTYTVPVGVLVGQDTNDALGVTLSCAATETTAAGAVPITGTGLAGNYTVTVTPAVLTITRAEITNIVTPAPEAVTILANDGNNTPENLKNVFTGGNALPAQVTVSYGNGRTESLPVTWSMFDAFHVKGGTYTFTGLLSVGNNFNGTDKKLIAQVTVTPVRVTEIMGVPTTRTVSKAQVMAAENLVSLGIPAQVTLKFDNGVNEQSIDAVFDKDMAAVKAIANEVTSAGDKTVDVSLTEANIPVWATCTVALPKTTITVTNKYVIPETDISFAPINITYGEDYVPSATVSNQPKYAGVTYTYTYRKNDKPVEKPTAAGVYAVTATVENKDYKGSKTVELVINPKTVAGVTAILPENYAPVYNKTEHRPVLTVKDGETTLLLNRDYTISYSDNISAGTATVTITGKGNYDSTTKVMRNFEISKADLSNLKPTILGEAKAGQTLTASLEGVDADEITWSWTVGENVVTDVEGDSYTVKDMDSNQPVTVKAAAVAGKNYIGVTQVSDGKTVNKVSVTGWLNITVNKDNGNADPDKADMIEAGDVLMAEANIIPAGIPLTYQWYSNGSAIPEATFSTYQVGQDARLLKVTADPGENFNGILTSSEVEVGKRILTGTISLTETPTFSVGGRIKLYVDTAASAEDYDIEWFRNGQAIPGLKDEFVIAREDLGTTLLIKVTANGTRYTGQLLPLTVDIPATRPDMPVVYADAGNGQVTVSWTVPFHNGAPITGYTLQVNDMLPISLPNDITSHTCVGLTNGMEYTFKIAAINAIGTSDVGLVKVTPKAPTVIPPHSGGGGGGNNGDSNSRAFSVSLPSRTENGTVKVNKKDPYEGEAVTIVVKPDPGYQVGKVTVTDKKGEMVAIKELGDGKYSFTMPATQVKIDVQFVEKAEQTIPVTPQETPVTEYFQDVKDTDWFVDAIQYVYDNDLMIGIDRDTFAPGLPTSRCMFVTILYRLEKKPATSATQFTDVASEKYYADAVAWAAENGIVNGYGDGTFRPNAALTREQLATILYRYASLKGYDIGEKADLNEFPDKSLISAYAYRPLEWANAVGIMNGTDWGGLYPGGYAIRAEVAAVLERFMEAVEK